MQIRSGTDALRHDLAALEREVLDQRRIQERAGGDQKAAEEAAVARRRMRAVVTRRQLVDIAKGQARAFAFRSRRRYHPPPAERPADALPPVAVCPLRPGCGPRGTPGGDPQHQAADVPVVRGHQGGPARA